MCGKSDTKGDESQAERPVEDAWQKIGKKGKTEGARPKEPEQKVTQTASHAAPAPKLTAYRKLCLTIEKDFPHLKTDDVNSVIDEVKRSYGGHFHGKLFSDIMRDIRNVVLLSFPDRLRSPHRAMPVFTSMAMQGNLKKPVADKKCEASWQSSTEGGNILFKAIEEECCICLVEFTKACRYPLECGHTFHKQCIDKWVKEQGERTCPICRNIVLMVEDYPRLAKKDPSPFDKDFPKLGSHLPKRGC
ncbi:E3 ubiquitin-protein ligase DZIP3-like [Littorina saxatilis]|uniref:E3 ubiquitin-protein ligase DZIP3-like n=1 Tax=Littorina saxatilis TaxID=31220 RepID=UPI0038B4B21B